MDDMEVKTINFYLGDRESGYTHRWPKYIDVMGRDMQIEA